MERTHPGRAAGSDHIYPPTGASTLPVEEIGNSQPQLKSKILIDESLPIPSTRGVAPQEAKLNIETSNGGAGVGSRALDKLRKQIAERANGTPSEQKVPLTKEKLEEAWQQYANQLRANKNPAFQSFELATLKILSENSFEVVANNNLEQKFIEQEKRVLSEQLQTIFGDRTLNFAIFVTDTPVEFKEVEKPLSKKDQYLLMIEQYPMIKELKERLKLELDY